MHIIILECRKRRNTDDFLSDFEWFFSTALGTDFSFTKTKTYHTGAPQGLKQIPMLYECVKIMSAYL